MAKRKLYKKSPQQDTACCPIIKVKMNDIDGLEREAQERISYSEKNIDPERSSLNLYVHGLDKKVDKEGNPVSIPVINGTKFTVPLKKRIFKRIKQCGAKIRTDKKKPPRKGFVERGQNTKESIVAIGMELQVSHALAMKLLAEDGLLDSQNRIMKGKTLPVGSKTYGFFRDSYIWACDRFGEKNVVGAYIHLDEYTPHMHVFVVPIAFKRRRYKKKDILDKDGNPLMAARLNAKGVFSQLHAMWADFGAKMQKYGATVAKGLRPKGSYDQVASMDAVIEQKRQQMEDIDIDMEEKRQQMEDIDIATVAKRKELLRLEEDQKKLSESIKPFLMIHDLIVERLQQIVDKDDSTSHATVLDYEIMEENKVAISQYGEKTPYVSRAYRIIADINGEKKDMIVDKDDYYKAKDKSLEKAFSRFFFYNLDTAKLGAEIHKTMKPKKSYGMKM